MPVCKKNESEKAYMKPTACSKDFSRNEADSRVLSKVSTSTSRIVPLAARWRRNRAFQRCDLNLSAPFVPLSPLDTPSLTRGHFEIVSSSCTDTFGTVFWGMRKFNIPTSLTSAPETSASCVLVFDCPPTSPSAAKTPHWIPRRMAR